MRRQTRQSCGPNGRRGTVIAASAAALCLAGGLLTGCGGSPEDGYAAVGAAGGGAERSAGGASGRPGPSGKVTLVPLDGEGAEEGSGRPGAGPAPGASSPPPAGGSGGPDAIYGPTGGPSARLPGSGAGEGGGGGIGSGARTGAPGGAGAGAAGPGAGVGAQPGEPSQPGRPDRPNKPSQPPEPAEPSTPGSGPKPGGGGGGTTTPPPSPPPGKPAPPPAPAALTLSAPQRAPADKRWCEKVTVEFRNTGGSPARSGTITFATHIIGALGVDWATIRSSQSLPAPIAAGAARSETYTVCVEAWRVPLGMRVETQDVSAVWE
ncbi:hypothetical protein [Streptomyces arboris]|uniref:hypothetical protein n=1 Tax=Streptomyces arboris TaxID=2600619 RepID=UPI003C30D22D